MRWYVLLPVVLALSLALLSESAFGETVDVGCKPRSEMVAFLKDTYGESLVSIGRLQSKGVMEVYASKSGTFSVIVTMPDSLTCLAAAGDAYQELKIKGKEI